MIERPEYLRNSSMELIE